MLTLNPGVVLSPLDEDVLGVDCTNYLDAGETIASGTVTPVTGLTLGSVVVNAAALVINGVSVAIGRAVTVTVKGQSTTGSPYTVPLLLVTSSARKKSFGLVFTVE